MFLESVAVAKPRTDCEYSRMTSDAMRIDLSELRSAFDTVVRHIESSEGTQVQLPVDYFWSVPSPDLYDVERNPPLTIGQVSESWENLRRERDGDNSATIGFAAVWLSEVLRAIGHETRG